MKATDLGSWCCRGWQNETQSNFRKEEAGGRLLVLQEALDSNTETDRLQKLEDHAQGCDAPVPWATLTVASSEMWHLRQAQLMALDPIDGQLTIDYRRR